jgi:hypothetical protein
MKGKAFAFVGVGGLIGGVIGGLIGGLLAVLKYDLSATAKMQQAAGWILCWLIIGGGVGYRLWSLRFPETSQPTNDQNDLQAAWQDLLEG